MDRQDFKDGTTPVSNRMLAINSATRRWRKIPDGRSAMAVVAVERATLTLLISPRIRKFRLRMRNYYV